MNMNGTANELERSTLMVLTGTRSEYSFSHELMSPILLGAMEKEVLKLT